MSLGTLEVTWGSQELQLHLTPDFALESRLKRHLWNCPSL